MPRKLFPEIVLLEILFLEMKIQSVYQTSLSINVYMMKADFYYERVFRILYLISYYRRKKQN